MLHVQYSMIKLEYHSDYITKLQSKILSELTICIFAYLHISTLSLASSY